MKHLIPLIALLIVVVISSPVFAGDPGMLLKPQALQYVLSDWTQCEIESYQFGYDFMYSDEEYCEITVNKYNLHVHHNDALFNCCIDEIDCVVIIEGNLIQIFEHEIFTHPCYCMCYFGANTHIYHLKPGEYNIEVWQVWNDGECSLRCEETAVLPGH